MNISYQKLVIIFVGMLVAGLMNSPAGAVSCNPRAQVHQQKALNIQMFLRDASKEDLDFLLCMTPEKEDKEYFKNEWQRLQNEKRASEEKEKRRRAEEAARKQQEQERAKQLEKEQAVREAKAERYVVSIRGNGGSYYLGHLMKGDVVMIEPLKGSYSSVEIMFDDMPMGYKPDPSKKPKLGTKIRLGDYGGTGTIYNQSGPLKIRNPGGGFTGGFAQAFLIFTSQDNMEIKATILCVDSARELPCNNR